jgi:hypothetical protein
MVLKLKVLRFLMMETNMINKEGFFIFMGIYCKTIYNETFIK